MTQLLPLLGGIAAAHRACAGPHDDGDLAGLVFTADALHVHRDNLRQVTDRGGEYIVTVKGNQPGLERDIAALFPASPVPERPGAGLRRGTLSSPWSCRFMPRRTGRSDSTRWPSWPGTG